jgi:cytochrome bd-type quinol oxidase subunit 1
LLRTYGSFIEHRRPLSNAVRADGHFSHALARFDDGHGHLSGIVEGLWLKTRNPDYYRHARFWSKLYVLNFGIGVASGLPMEFQFGTNWAPFSEAVGDFFGSILGFEGAMAFMLEAGVSGHYAVWLGASAPVIHYLATIMVAFGANLSTFWILVANSWLQSPAGGEMVNGKFIVSDYFQAIANPFYGQERVAHVLCHPGNLAVCDWRH